MQNIELSIWNDNLLCIYKLLRSIYVQKKIEFNWINELERVVQFTDLLSLAEKVKYCSEILQKLNASLIMTEWKCR